jgi:tetratricopeptide (TPR) repeat protein
MRAEAIYDAVHHVIGHDEKTADLNVLEAVDRAREIGQLSKKWRHAIRFLRLAVLIDPDSIEAHYGLASCLFMMGQYKESVKEYEIVRLAGSNEVVDKEYELVKEIADREDRRD